MHRKLQTRGSLLRTNYVNPLAITFHLSSFLPNGHLLIVDLSLQSIDHNRIFAHFSSHSSVKLFSSVAICSGHPRALFKTSTFLERDKRQCWQCVTLIFAGMHCIPYLFCCQGRPLLILTCTVTTSADRAHRCACQTVLHFALDQIIAIF